ncbi:MAG: patatin-like phospholipase family protein [Clostridiaceae bacterium]|nr:patatin-like phospholipase family protein [Clostridiaceae bacterium]
MNEYGLVLAGGGARGAYQIGVWQALRDLGISIKAAVGVSIGAINAALICQGDWDLAYQAWHQVSIRDLVKLPEPLPVADDLFDFHNLPALARLVIQEKGLDTTPLRSQLEQYIEEKRLRESAIEFGLLTYSITDMQPVTVFRQDIQSGQILDYILASASMPVFRAVRIEGKRFIDGGVYNNRPTEMLIEKGYQRLIEIEVGGIGPIRPYNRSGLEIISIKPTRPLGGLMDVRNETLDVSISTGYQDAMEAMRRHRPV